MAIRNSVTTATTAEAIGQTSRIDTRTWPGHRGVVEPTIPLCRVYKYIDRVAPWPRKRGPHCVHCTDAGCRVHRTPRLFWSIMLLRCSAFGHGICLSNWLVLGSEASLCCTHPVQMLKNGRSTWNSDPVQCSKATRQISTMRPVGRCVVYGMSTSDHLPQLRAGYMCVGLF